MGPLLLAAFVQTALTLDVSVDYEKSSLAGRASITVESRGPPSQRLSLLLGRLMRATAVSSGGKPLKFEQEVVVFEDDPMRQVRQLRIDLPSPKATVDVEYSGPLVGYVETGSLYIKDRIDPEFTILRSDAYAFPVVGVPSRAANRAVRQPDFSFDATVRVPPGQVVAAGGALVSKAPWRFKSEAAPFLNIAIAPYVLRESGGIRVYTLPADAATGEAVLESARRALGLFAKWYGPLDREPSLSIMEIPSGFGSQANLAAGIILVREAFVDVSDRQQLYHELSHIWNAPDLDQPSARWNEGLATYLEVRIARELDDYTGTDATVAWARKRACTAPKDIPLRRYGEKALTDYSYSVGFLMFHELDSRMGAPALDAAIRDWFQQHKRGATTEDLHDALRKHGAPEALWEKWMTTTGWREGC